MEKDNLSCTEISEKESACCESKTLKIFDKFQALYEDQLSKIDESSVDSLQLKVKLLQDWVADLTEQNVTLVKTVEELEEEALKRVALLEAHMPQKQDPHDPCLTTKLSSQQSSILQLTTELGQVKKQLLDKECLLKSYLKRIEDLRQNAEASKQVKHRSSMTEETWTSKTDQLSKLHDELNRVEMHLNKTQQETSDLKCKLSEAEENVQKLKCHLLTSEENARDMRAALTAEVAEKHDMILTLKREVQQLEEKLRQANMQTHFKDVIIKELRMEAKVARSKETLAEVLGIKEKSRLHIKDKVDQLTEQIAEKDKLIACLDLKLQNYVESVEQDQEARMKSVEQREKALKAAEATICKVKQKITLFIDDVVTVCVREPVNRQFQLKMKKLLKELIESSNCPQSSKVLENLLPCDHPREECANKPLVQQEKQVRSLYVSGQRSTGSEGELWEAQRLSELHKSIDQDHRKLLHSWTQLKNTSQQLNCDGLSVELEQYKMCAAEEQCILNKLQNEVNLLLANIASREVQTGCFNRQIESLRECLLNIQYQIRQGCHNFALVNGSSSSECQYSDNNGSSSTSECHYSDKGDIQAWMKRLRESLSTAHNVLKDLEKNVKMIKEEREEMLRTSKTSEAVIQSLQQQLNCMQQVRQRAFDKLYTSERKQREEWNQLITSVLHYHDMYKEEQVASDDMKEEMQFLLKSLAAKASNQLCREEKSGDVRHSSPCDKRNLKCKSSQSWDSALQVYREEEYSALMKAQQEVETLRHLVNMRSDQLPHRVQVLVVRVKEEIMSITQIFSCRDKQLSQLENQIFYLHETLQSFDLKMEMTNMSDKLHLLQEAIKHFLVHTKQYVSERNLYKQNQSSAQSRLTALQTELETLTGQNTEVTPRLNAAKLEPKSLTLKSEQDKTMTVSNILCGDHDCIFKEKLRRTEDDILQVKSQLAEKENIMGQLRDDLHELSCNLQARDILVRTQEQTINLLQNSLTIEQEEGSALRFKISDMETSRTCMVKEYSQKTEEMEAMIMKLQDSVKSTDEASLGVTQEIAVLCKTVFVELMTQYEQFYKEVVKENTAAESLRDINLELAILAGQLHHKYQQAKQKLSDCYKIHNESERKLQRANAALQIVIRNINDRLKAEKMKRKQVEQEKVCLQQILEKHSEKQKDLNAVTELHMEIAHYQHEISRLVSQVSELKASHQHSSMYEADSNFNEQSLHKRVNDLSEELACVNDENNKLALENELVLNKMQSGNKINEIHKERIEELRLALARKTQEMQQLETSQKRYFMECLVLRKELRKSKEKMCKMKHEIESAKKIMLANELAQNEICALKETLAQKTHKLAEITEVSTKAELELEMRCKEQETIIDKLRENMCDLSHQVKTLSERCECAETELSRCQEKLLQTIKREERVHQEVSNKETELLKRICDEQTHVCKLSDELKDQAEELSCVRALLDQEKSRHIASQQILQKTVMEMNEVKGKLKESNATVHKLQGALTHVSTKVVTQVQKLEDKEAVIKEQEEQLAQLECLLKEKIEELKVKDQEIEELHCKCSKLKQELEINTESEIRELQCRVKQLVAELEASRRNEQCHADLINEQTQKLAQKEEELYHIKMELVQFSKQKCEDLKCKDQEMEELQHEYSKLKRECQTKAAERSEIWALQCKVKQLNAELEAARRNGQCHADFLNEQTQKMAQKDEDLYCMKVQLKQCNKQLECNHMFVNTLLPEANPQSKQHKQCLPKENQAKNNHLEEELKSETAQVTSLEESNCKLMHKLQQCELYNNKLLYQVNTLQQLVCDLRSDQKEGAQRGISRQPVCRDEEVLAEQREISLQLATELRQNQKQLKALAHENRSMKKLLRKRPSANASLSKESCKLSNLEKKSVIVTNSDTIFNSTTDSDFDASSKSKLALILSETHVSVSKQFLNRKH